MLLIQRCKMCIILLKKLLKFFFFQITVHKNNYQSNFVICNGLLINFISVPVYYTKMQVFIHSLIMAESGIGASP